MCPLGLVMYLFCRYGHQDAGDKISLVPYWVWHHATVWDRSTVAQASVR